MLQCILHTQLGKDYTYSSGIATCTPGHTRACVHVKFTGARVKIQVQTERMLFVAKNDLRNDLRVNGRSMPQFS